MKKFIAVCLTVLCCNFTMMANTKTVKIRIVQTSDVHGSFFPYDFTNRKPTSGSLARVSTYVDSLRKSYGKNLILLDNGDILQGQPSCYFYNYLQTNDQNVAASIMNYMKYDAQTIGNHDIETGHIVYDKWMHELKSPTLGANMINTETNRPYVSPYTILVRNGVKIAILGLITPAIPKWLDESLWKNLRFDNMLTSARYWLGVLQKKEQPDIIIGLFHSGRDGGIITDQYEENASLRIAREIPGFDLILFGHDHASFNETIINSKGEKVTCLDPSNNARLLSDAEITLVVDKNKKQRKDKKSIISKNVKGELVDISHIDINQTFMKHFQPQIELINQFVDRKIGKIQNTIYSRDSYFGCAPFTDLIHDIQLRVTNADISFTAPLTFDSKINKGDIYVADLFNLYKFENQIYTVKMTGEEIRKYLEMSYDLWINTMKTPDDHIMLLNEKENDDQQRYKFKNLAFNFDSAAGIDYEVDVTKPYGQKIHIIGISNGKPFDLSSTYSVAMNSYRANGGGELITKGAGISEERLKHRIVYKSDKDQRYYLMEWIEKTHIIDPQPHHNWRFVPESWTHDALIKDKNLIFGEDK